MIKTITGINALPVNVGAKPRITEAQLVDEHGAAVYKFCRSITSTKHDADDLFQDTFVNVFSNMPKIEKAENTKGFLLSTAAYLWKSQRRKYARRHKIAQDFIISAMAEKSDDGSCEITVVMSFRNANGSIGEKAHLKIGNLNFITHGVLSDDNAVDQQTMLSGIWEFDVDIDSRFANVSKILYIAADPQAAQSHGITIHSVTVLPSTCRIEAAIDYSKNALANPNNIGMADSPRLLGKLDWLDTSVAAESGNKTFGGMSSNYSEVNGRVVECSFEIDSMYFDAPENITLRFEGYGGTIINIPLTRDR